MNQSRILSRTPYANYYFFIMRIAWFTLWKACFRSKNTPDVRLLIRYNVVSIGKPKMTEYKATFPDSFNNPLVKNVLTMSASRKKINVGPVSAESTGY